MGTYLKSKAEMPYFNITEDMFNKVKFNEKANCSTKGRITVRYCNKQGTCIAQLPQKAGHPFGNPAFTF